MYDRDLARIDPMYQFDPLRAVNFRQSRHSQVGYSAAASSHVDDQRARMEGRRISSASAESVVNHLMNRRLSKRQQMRWSLKGAHYAYRRAGVRGHYFGHTDKGAGKILNHGHSIAALLVSSQGRVLAIAENMKASNETYHAEVNLVQAYMSLFNSFEKGREGAVAIYTTLKPCKMCAAMISHAFPCSIIIYGQDDPGRHAQVIDKPMHGAYQLSQMGPTVKALQMYDSDSAIGNKTGEISGALSETWKRNKEKTGYQGLTNALDTVAAADQMLFASLSLDRKIKRYATVKPADTERRVAVSKVLKHLEPLLDRI